MKKLTAPDVTNADKLLDGAIARKRILAYATSLMANETYIKSRYNNYSDNLNRLEDIGGSSIVSADDREAIHSMFTSSFKEKMKNNELAQVYQECAGVCPFCSTGKLEEIDHYIPKEPYPEFTIYPLNLIPICNKCNKKKGEMFIDASGQRYFINFYSDNIDNLMFLEVTISFDSTNIEKTTKVSFVADFSKITDGYLREIIEKHYLRLELIRKYNEAAAAEVSNLFDILSNQDDNNKEEIKNAASRIVIGTKNKQLRQAGRNDWKYLLYEEMIKVNYVDALVDSICEE